MNKENRYIFSIIATYFYDTPEVMEKILAEQTDFERLSREEMKTESNNFSEEKKIAIFAYIFLYDQITNDNGNLNHILELLNLPHTLKRNCASIFDDIRIKYVISEYSSKNKDFFEIFIEPEDYITESINRIVLLPISEPKKILTGLSINDFMHNFDRTATEKLRGNIALEKALKLYSRYDIERLITIQYTGTNIKVTSKNIPYLYEILEEACRVLDIKEIPELYLEQGFINACTIGADKPIIVLSNSTLSLLTRDELLFIIGHELGHIKCQHVLYSMIAQYLPSIAQYIGNMTFGIGDLVGQIANAALFDWLRKAEFSADRAGLLVCQDLNSAISTMQKLAGFPPKFYEFLDTEDFIAQAESFNSFDNNTFDKALKFVSSMYADHPWTVYRAYEMMRWAETGSYDRILNKNKAEIGYSCPHCGAPYRIGAKFCGNCGTEIPQ